MMSGAFSMYWERRGDTGFWWGKPKGKKPLGRGRHRWKDKITMDF
jgi:hypothetical protein